MVLSLTFGCNTFPCRAESQMFKARFVGWDDVLAVDYTLSADYVSKAAKQLGVTVRAKCFMYINLHLILLENQ